MESSYVRYANADGYFFADRETNWERLGISLLTGCIFSPYVLGLLAPGMAIGVALVYGVTSAIMLALLGRVFAPLYLKLGIGTFPEYFERRFDRKSRLFVSALFIVQNIALKLMIVLSVGSVIIGKILHLDAFSSLLLFLIIAGIYVIIGGLRAELYASVIQIFLIILGVIAVAAWGIQDSYGATRLAPGGNSLALFEGGLPSFPDWMSLAAGLPLLGFWFWCADQTVVQKVMSVQSLASARNASVVSGLLQAVPVLTVALLGSMVTFPTSSLAMEQAVRMVIPAAVVPGILRGALVLAIASALIASLAGIFNGTSLLITYDFYRSFRPAASARSLVLVGRMTAIVLLACSILIIPAAQTMDLTFCMHLFTIFAACAAVVSAVFLAGLTSRHINSANAFFALCAATCIILLRISLEWLLGGDAGGGFPGWLIRSDFMEFSLFVFLLTIMFLFLFNGLERILKKGGERPREEAHTTSWSTVSFPEQTSKEQQ